MKYLKIAFRGTAYVCFTLLFMAGIIILYEEMFIPIWESKEGIGTALLAIGFYLFMVLLCSVMYVLLNSLVNSKNFFGRFLDKTFFKEL